LASAFESFRDLLTSDPAHRAMPDVLAVASFPYGKLATANP
jgi:hypothetical protein